MSTLPVPRRYRPRLWPIRHSSPLAPGGLALFLGALLIVSGWTLSLVSGSVHLSWQDLWTALVGRTEDVAGNIVWNLRIPRALLAAVVGSNLAVAGVLLQGVLRNPLASPDIIGVTQGAALAASIVLLTTTGLPAHLPAFAFIGALVASLLVYGISFQPGEGTSPMRMVLAGVAVGMMLGGITSFLMVTFSDRVQSVILWMSGSLQDAGWHKLNLILPYALVGVIISSTLIQPLDTLQLGEETAACLGIHIERSRLIATGAAALLGGSAIAVTGLIGFVGLIVPHLTRMLVGHRHAILLPASALGGASLMIWADFAARIAVAPTELPVGILTALLGGPYFVYLLYRRKFS